MISQLQGVIPHKGDLCRVSTGCFCCQRANKAEKKRFIEGEGLRRERLLRVPQSGMMWTPPSSLTKRLKPIRGQVRPERALSKGTVLPGSKPKGEAPGNTGEHQGTIAGPHPRIRRLLGNRAAGREGCELGAVRAPRCKPSRGHQVMNVCAP